MSDALRSSAWSLKWEDICPQTTTSSDLAGSILNILGSLGSNTAGKQDGDCSLANGLLDKSNGTSNASVESRLRPVASFSDLNAELSSLPNGKKAVTTAPEVRVAQTKARTTSVQAERKVQNTKARPLEESSPAKPSRATGGMPKKCASTGAMRTSNSADIADLVSFPDVVETDSCDLLEEFETMLGRLGFCSSFTLRRPASKNTPNGKANSASQLRHATRELLETERTYVADLGALVNGYMREVRDSGQFKLSEAQLATLFGNLPDLLGLHMEILAELDTVTLPDAAGDVQATERHTEALAASAGRVGVLLSRFATRFDQYAPYCTNFPRAIQLFSELQKEPQVATMLQLAQSRLGHSLPLPTYLLKPVQRILKYHLLLESMLKRLEPACGEPHTALTNAHAALVKVAQEINELKRRQDHRERGAQICTQLMPQLRKHVTTDDVNRMQMSMTTSMYETSCEQHAPQASAKSHVRAEYTVPGSSVPNKLDVDTTTLFGELILEDEFALYGKKPNSRWRCFLFDRALIITKCVTTETGVTGRARVKTVVSCANLMLIESIANDSLAFHVIPFDNPRLQHTLQARSSEQKREWCMQIKRLMLENFGGGIPERSKELFLRMTELQPNRPAQPKGSVDLSKSRFQYPEYLINNKRRSLLPQQQELTNGHNNHNHNANGTLKKRKNSLFPDLFGTLRPRGLRRSMTAYQREADANANVSESEASRNRNEDKMYRTLPVRGAKAKKAKAQKNAQVQQEHAEPMKKRRSVESLTDVDCTLTFSDILSEYELARARGGIHVPTQNDGDKNKSTHAFVPLNFHALRKSALDRGDAVVDIAVDINMERQSATPANAPRNRVSHSRQGSSILTSNITCPLYLVFDADADAKSLATVAPLDNSDGDAKRGEKAGATARFATIDSSERRLAYDQAFQLYLEKQSLTFDDMDSILKPLREHKEEQSAKHSLDSKRSAAALAGEPEPEAETEADEPEVSHSSPTDIVSQIALEQLLFRQIRRFQTGPKGLTPTNSVLALGGTLPNSSTPSESADSAYVTPLPKEASRTRPVNKTASLRGVKFGERSRTTTGYECHDEDDEVSLSSSSGSCSPALADDPALTIVSVDTAHAHRRQLSNQLKAAMQSASETNLLSAAPFSLPSDREHTDSTNRGCYTPTISRRDRLLRPFRSIFGSQKNVAVHDVPRTPKKPLRPPSVPPPPPPSASTSASVSSSSAKKPPNKPPPPPPKPTRTDSANAKRPVTASSVTNGKASRPSKKRTRKAKSELNVNRESISTSSSTRTSAERELTTTTASLTGSLSPPLRSQSLRRRSSPSTASKKGLLYRLFSYFQHANAKAQHVNVQQRTTAPSSFATQSPSLSSSGCKDAPPTPSVAPTPTPTQPSATTPIVDVVKPPLTPVVPTALDLVQIPFVDDAS